MKMGELREVLNGNTSIYLYVPGDGDQEVDGSYWIYCDDPDLNKYDEREIEFIALEIDDDLEAFLDVQLAPKS